MRLYSYWRSTTSYRVRAALNLKGLPYVIQPVDLAAGAQNGAGYTALNPAQAVPALVLDDGTVLTQSLAIIDYLDAMHPAPRLIPQDPMLRARALALAHIVAMDIHPVNNQRTLAQLHSRFGADAAAGQNWMQHWMTKGFTTIEALLPKADTFAFENRPCIADICITAQVYNARRWGLALAAFPKITRIEAQCLALPAFQSAHPDQQPDAKDLS